MTVESKKAASGPFRFKKDALLKAALLLLTFGILLLLYVSIKNPALDTTNYTLERQSASFLIVSTLKSSLAVIEGSDIGVGFSLEVGDIMQATYDLVDFTWKILLYGILLMTFSKIMCESDLIKIGLYILAVGFLLKISGLFIRQYKKKILSLGAVMIIGGMIVSFYIPVSTLVSFRACEYFIGHIEKDMNHQMQEVLADWEKFKSEFSPSELKNFVQNAASFVKSLFLKLTRILITFTCLIIIRYLLFPVIVAYGFFIISKAFLKQKFE